MVASSFLALLAAGAEDNGERTEQAAEPSRAATTSQAAAPSYAELAAASGGEGVDSADSPRRKARCPPPPAPRLPPRVHHAPQHIARAWPLFLKRYIRLPAASRARSG